jgi:alkylation response protein AidB-like acyl-CoA dehydrogenase
MMEHTLFEITPKAQEIVSQIETFVNEEVMPLESLLLDHQYDELEAQMAEVRAEAKKQGIWLPQIPEEYGGLGLSLVEHGLASEALGRSPLGHYACNCQAPDAGNMEILIEHGTPEQKERFLMPLLAGEIRSCFSMTEPEHPGSNPTWMSTTAVKDGDDYVINGHKWFTSAAEGAAFAIVMAVTDAAAGRHRQASMIIVPTDTPGFRLVENTSVMGERGRGWASHGEIRYEDCRVPQSNRLGYWYRHERAARIYDGPDEVHKWSVARRIFQRYQS